MVIGYRETLRMVRNLPTGYRRIDGSTNYYPFDFPKAAGFRLPRSYQLSHLPLADILPFLGTP
jgi:hypothetical protein